MVAVLAPSEHFAAYVRAAVGLLLQQLHRTGRLAEALERFPFLLEYGEAAAREPEGAASWPSELLPLDEALTAPARGGAPASPVATLRREMGLDLTQVLLLVMAGLPEHDPRFGALYAYMLQFASPYCRPSWPLIRQLLDGLGDVGQVCSPLLRTGLLTVVNPEFPRPEWEFAVPALLWDLLSGAAHIVMPAWCRHREAQALPPLEELLLESDLLARLQQMPALMRQGQARTVVVRAPAGCEAAEVLGSLARALGLGLLQVAAADLAQERVRQTLGPLCTLTGALPVITYELGPGEAAALPDLPGYAGPFGAVLGLEGGLTGAPGDQTVTFELGIPAADLRLRRWQQALGARAPHDLGDVAERYALGGGHISSVAERALLQASLEQRERVERSDIRAGLRSLGAHLLENLAVRLEARGRWDEVAVSDQTLQSLKHLERRCRHRERLTQHLSPAYSAGVGGGVRALLSGPSGTGKTLAARVLAAELGLEIYRVDLAAVVNKYIGETEKNLSQVLARAESLGVILLLDEGDSLLGKRSEVRSSNDRYANLQTNYLLQRLESYSGIVLVTTNLGQSIDQAFQRRMDAVIEFLPPSDAERLRIWRLHLPDGHEVDDGFLQEVAGRCNMTGGQIRNAALQAALLALDARRPVGRGDVAEAVRMEYRKAGTLCPLPMGMR